MLSVLYKDDQVEKQLGIGPSPQLEVELPLGPVYDNHRVALWVRIADNLGAVNNHFIGQVQVCDGCRHTATLVLLPTTASMLITLIINISHVGIVIISQCHVGV